MQLKTVYKLRLLSGTVGILGILCFLAGAECKRSACWRYGHVCWGGHGKRSGPPSPLPTLDSTETKDGNRNVNWNLQLPLPLKATKEIDHFSNNNPPMRKHLHTLNSKFSHQPPLPMQHGDFLQSGYIPYQTVPIILARNERQISPRVSAIGKPTLDTEEDGGFSSSDSVIHLMPTEDSGEMIFGSQPYLKGIKRANEETQRGLNGNTAGSSGSTEEPLVTSANGLDSNPRSAATFFRDRKSDNLGKQRYFKNGEKPSHISSPQRIQSNNEMLHILPMAQFKQNGISNQRYFY